MNLTLASRNLNNCAGERGEEALIRGAEYVRMSANHQKYSTENQADAIRAYAAQRGIKIVKTYADSGKSGSVSTAEMP
jgi:hypothetical protein